MMAEAAGRTMSPRRDRELTPPAVSLLRAAGWMPLWTLLVGLVCLIYLIATSSVLGVGYDIQRLERERGEWRSRNEQLQLELAKVRSLAWVEAQATARLGMVKPEQVTYLEVDAAALAAYDDRPAVAARAQPLPPATPDPFRLAAERVGALLPGQP